MTGEALTEAERDTLRDVMADGRVADSHAKHGVPVEPRLLDQVLRAECGRFVEHLAPAVEAILEERLTDSAPDDPAALVAGLAARAEVLNAALLGYSPEDWRDAARLLHALRGVTTTLQALDATLVTWLYLHGEHGIHQHIDGIPGEVTITRGRAKERWEATAAIRDYVEAQIIANDGEAPDPLQVMAWVLEVVPATASTSLRKTPLRNAGLDVDDYYASEPGSLQVGLPATPPSTR